MIVNGYFGRWETWALIAGAWIIASVITAITFGVIARWGEKGEEGE